MGGRLEQTLTLVKRAKAGDDQALNLLLSNYMDRVLKMVRLRMGPSIRTRLESMDVVQDVMFRAIKAFDNFEVRNEATFLHWIRKIVQNEINNIADYQFADKRNPNKEMQPVLEEGQNKSIISNIPADSMWSPTGQLQLKDELASLETAMDQLDAEQKEIIIMREYEEFSFKEIGQFMSCTPDAARMKFARALDKLTDILNNS